MITKGYYRESRSATIFDFSIDSALISDFGAGSDNVVLFQKDFDFNKIDKINSFISGDKLTDAGADNTITVKIGGVTKQTVTFPSTTEVNNFTAIDCTAITGTQTILIQGGGGSDHLIVNAMNLTIIET